MNWPTTNAILDALKLEAYGDSVRLGHWLYPWTVTESGGVSASCYYCRAEVVIQPRVLGIARVRGEVVNLECTGRKK